MKRFLTEAVNVDVSAWPVRADFFEYVQTHAKAGRRIVLATAADDKIANAIAARFDFITEVVASDGERNMKVQKQQPFRRGIPRGLFMPEIRQLILQSGNQQPPTFS